MLDILGTFKEGSISGWTVSSCEQGVAGRSTSRCLDVVSSESPSARGESIDVRRLDVVLSEAIQLWAEVIDADEKDVRLRPNEGGSEEEEENFYHG